LSVRLPLSGNSKPAIIRNSVVLPEPEGPTITVRLPVGTLRLTSSSAFARRRFY
jgi:hypothetical protein